MTTESLDGITDEALFDYEKLKHFLKERIPVVIMLWKNKLQNGQKDAFTYSMVGMLHIHLEECDESIKYLYKPTELEPDNPRHWDQLGFIHAKRGNYPRAIDYYKQALQKDYSRVGTLLRLAYCYEQQGATDLALKNYHKAHEFDEENPSTLTKLAMIYYQENNIPKATLYFIEVLAHDGLNPEILLHLGFCYAKTNNLDEAFEQFKKVVLLQEDNLDAWYQLALIYAKQKQEQQVLNVLKGLVKVDSSYKKQIQLGVEFDFLKSDVEFRTLFD